MMKALTTAEFIVKASLKHNKKYDYSKTKYIKSQEKVCIICPKHGEFWQTPNNHLSGKGCPICKREMLHSLKKKAQEDFIYEANKIHNFKYDYSKVNYINNVTKVCIICPNHGEFWQMPHNHLLGRGCLKCVERKWQYGVSRHHMTQEEFVKNAKEKHHNKFDYSKVEYKNCNTKVCIVCPNHGDFWQAPTKHLNGQGCPKCANEQKCLTLQEFKDRANKTHNNFYDYTKVSFHSVRDYITIICPIHGGFTQNVMSHLRGHGCQCCNTSLLEKEVERELKKTNNTYVYQCSFKDLPWLNRQTLDFYIPYKNIAIECQGEQHFKLIDFSGRNKERAANEFSYTKERDERKKRLCEENGVRLLYFTKKKFLKKGNNVIDGEYFFNPQDIHKLLNE